jgi:hypothetical protein
MNSYGTNVKDRYSPNGKILKDSNGENKKNHGGLSFMFTESGIKLILSMLKEMNAITEDKVVIPGHGGVTGEYDEEEGNEVRLVTTQLNLKGKKCFTDGYIETTSKDSSIQHTDRMIRQAGVFCADARVRNASDYMEDLI